MIERDLTAEVEPAWVYALTSPVEFGGVTVSGQGITTALVDPSCVLSPQDLLSRQGVLTPTALCKPPTSGKTLHVRFTVEPGTEPGRRDISLNLASGEQRPYGTRLRVAAAGSATLTAAAYLPLGPGQPEAIPINDLMNGEPLLPDPAPAARTRPVRLTFSGDGVGLGFLKFSTSGCLESASLRSVNTHTLEVTATFKVPGGSVVTSHADLPRTYCSWFIYDPALDPVIASSPRHAGKGLGNFTWLAPEASTIRLVPLTLPLAGDYPPPQVGELTTSLFGGDGGLTPYRLSCGPDEVLIGVEVNAGAWLHRVGIICMPVSRDGHWAQGWADTGFSDFSTGGPEKNDDSHRTRVCDRNFAVQGIRGRQGMYVDRLQLECRPLINGTFTDGARRLTAPVGGEGGSRFGPARCPDDRAATGLYGYSEGYVDSIGLQCVDENYWRPSFHFSPRTGWMNDPAGLVYLNGRYHLYYQAIPGQTVFKTENVEWGHAVSTDLVNWTQHDSVFRPERGLANIVVSPFTGSGIVTAPQGGLRNGACDCAAGVTGRCIVSLLTRHVNPAAPQYQVLAQSCNGGMSFGNELTVLESISDYPHFRDPKVFLYENPNDPDNRYWVMTIAAGDSIKFYRSGRANDEPLDLTHWTELSAIRIFGGGLTGPFAETPDLIELPVINGRGSRWVLLFAEGYFPFVQDDDPGAPKYSKAWYLVGHFDGTRFLVATPDTDSMPANAIELARRMDGPDFYAPQTWFIGPRPDLSRAIRTGRPPIVTRRGANAGSRAVRLRQPLASRPGERRILAGWLNNWLYAHALPTGRWRGQLAIPRELGLWRQPDGDMVLVQAPVRELESQRRPQPLDWSWEDVTIDERKRTIPMPSYAALAYEAEIVVDMTDGAQELKLGIRHGTGPGRAVVGWDRIGTDGPNGMLYLDRAAGFAAGVAPMGFAEHFTVPLALDEGRLRLRVLVDRSSIEVFGGHGEAVLSAAFFPHPGNRQFTIQALGGSVHIVKLDLYPL